MWDGWRGIEGRDNLRGSNMRTRVTSDRSCARAWAFSSAWPLSRCCRKVAASSFGVSGFGGCIRPISCTASSTSVMSLWSSVPTG